ncbi:MAG: D-glycerate dehydrogenase [Chloroflexi bacterium]|nr:D-glycerate dehydrogenase [Chloroflexota bacterium]
MSKPHVFVARLIPEEGLAMLRDVVALDVWEDELPPPRQVILEKVRTVDGIISLLTDKMDAEVMDANPRLRVISNYAVGFDNVDIPAATARGIPVGNTPGVLTDTTADLAFTLLMASARRIQESIDYVRAGKWKTWGPKLLTGQDIHGATLGIIGFGRIGQEMARRANGFRMRVLYYDLNRNVEAEKALSATLVDLDTLLRESDFVSVHTNLTDATRHLLDARAFAKMKRTAIVINTARGPIVDPNDLYDALKSGRIGGAALDVTEPEPIPLDSPLLTLPNCLIVPHIASASVATRAKMAQMAAANLIAGVRGQRLPTCVNPEVYARGIRQ